MSRFTLFRASFFAIATLLWASLPSCKTTTKVVTMRDTLHVERAVVQEVYRHDTLTIHDSTEIVREVVKYDTLGRITEAMQEHLRHGKSESRGEAMQAVTRDTIYITRTVTKSVTKKSEPKEPGMTAKVAEWILLCAIVYIIYLLAKHNIQQWKRTK